MAIEITPKPKIKAPLWAINLLILCLILLAALLVSYIYFKKASEKLTEDLKVTTAENILAQEIKERSQELSLYQKKIDDFGILISEHKKTVNIFEFLERTTHPNVWFSDFGFDSPKNMVEVSGQAESFVVLGQQLLIFKKEEVIKAINLSDVSIGEEGGVNFSLSLTFNNQIFK